MSEDYKFIVVNSFNRASGTDTNFNVNLNGTFPERFSQMCLLNLIMTNTMYNVTTSNNTFVFQETGEDAVTCSLSVGNYTIYDIINNLPTAMNAVSPLSRTYTMSISSITNKLTITASAGTFTVLSSGGLNLMLGFSTNNNSTTGLTVTGTRVYNMARYGGLMLYCSSCKGDVYNTVTGNRQGNLAYIPVVEANTGELFSFRPHALEWRDLSQENIDTMNFRLADDTSKDVDLNGGYMALYIALR